MKDVQTSVRARPIRPDENIAAIRESVAENPKESIPRRSQQLGLTQTTTWRILRKDLALDAYKIQLTQKLKPADNGQRLMFVNFVLYKPPFKQKKTKSKSVHPFGSYDATDRYTR